MREDRNTESGTTCQLAQEIRFFPDTDRPLPDVLAEIRSAIPQMLEDGRDWVIALDIPEVDGGSPWTEGNTCVCLYRPDTSAYEPSDPGDIHDSLRVIFAAIERRLQSCTRPWVLSFKTLAEQCSFRDMSYLHEANRKVANMLCNDTRMEAIIEEYIPDSHEAEDNSEET